MTGLAGWLFADLLLVLFITAFASTTIPSVPPKPAPTPTGHPTPVSSRSPAPRPRAVLVLKPYVYQLRVPYPAILGRDGSSQAGHVMADELESELKAQGLTGAQAGLVEAFGWSPSASGDGTIVAAAVNRAITMNLPLFATAYQQSFWNSGPDGTVTLRVFFFARD